MPETITHKINRVFTPLLEVNHGVIILKGGTGSGKSQFAQQKLIDLCLEGRGVLALRKVQKDARHSVYQLFEILLKELDIYDQFIHDKTNWEFRYKHGPGFIRCGGLDDPERVKSVVGIDIVFLEEATEFTLADYLELQRRVRATPYKLFILAFNPISEYSWINIYFYRELDLERGLEGTPEQRIGRDYFIIDVEGEQVFLPVVALTTNYGDNVFMLLEDKANILHLKTTKPNDYLVYGKALWGQVEGVIISNYRVQAFDLSIINGMRQRSSGMDFGYVHNTALVRLAYAPAEKTVYAYGGFYGPGLTTPEMITNLGNTDWLLNEVTRADSADPGRIKEIAMAGVKIIAAEKGTGSIVSFMNWAQEQTWMIHPSCAFLADEFSSWKFKKNRSGKHDLPADGTEENPDDAVAAARYASEVWWMRRGNRALSPKNIRSKKLRRVQ